MVENFKPDLTTLPIIIEEKKELIVDSKITTNDLIQNKLNDEEIIKIMDEVIEQEKHLLIHKKRKFITVKSQQDKEKFIIYKVVNKNKDKKNKKKISILSYNILNQLHIKKVYQPELKVDCRMNKIKMEILELKPDIFCLQEADIAIYKNYLLQKDMEQYNILYGVNCGSSFINIIAYKKEKFIFRAFKNFSLLFLGEDAGNRGIMNLVLEYKINEDEFNENLNKNGNNKENFPVNKSISIYNVHFPWKNENDRLILLNMIFEHIRKNHLLAKTNPPKIPTPLSLNNQNIFIVGDFNSEPSSKIIKLFYYNKFKKEKNNFFDKQKQNFDIKTLMLYKYIYKDFKFKSAYQHYSGFKIDEGDYKRHPLFTSRTKFYKRTLDYIFYSKNMKLRKILRLPDNYEIEKEEFLPCKDYPSTHLKLYSELYLK